MIIVHRFPTESNSLSMLLGLFHNQRFQMDCTWSYTGATELNVQISLRGEQANSLESILSAFLSANGYQYVFAPDKDTRLSINNMQNFVLVPQRNGQSGCHAELSKASLFVLLTGLQKNDGTFNVYLTGDSNGLQIAVGITCRRGCLPFEVDFAFGRRFRLVASDSIAWFRFVENEHHDLLTMPYTSPDGCSLVTGFGDVEQAIIKPVGNSVAIGPIFNDALNRKLCFTEENWRSSTCVWGAPGYGKTTLCLNLLLQAYRKQSINFLVIEPKKDYRRLKRLIPEMKVLPTLRGHNPLVPPRGCSPFEYCEAFLDLLNLATEMPQESPLPDYLRRIYYQAIADKDYSMGHFLQLYDALMQQMGFTGEAVNFCRAGRNRIATIFRLFCGSNFASRPFPGFDISQFLNCPTVVEIGKVSTQKMTTVFTYFVIAHMRMVMQGRESDKITNCLLIEEAHTVLSPIMNDGLRFDLANLLAEGRGRGLSLIIAEQSPSRIDPQAANLCGNVFSFRVVSKDDQEYVANQLGISPASLNDLRKRSVIARTNSMYNSESVLVEADSEILSLLPLTDEELKALASSQPA